MLIFCWSLRPSGQYSLEKPLFRSPKLFEIDFLRDNGYPKDFHQVGERETKIQHSSEHTNAGLQNSLTSYLWFPFCLHSAFIILYVVFLSRIQLHVSIMPTRLNYYSLQAAIQFSKLFQLPCTKQKTRFAISSQVYITFLFFPPQCNLIVVTLHEK